MVIKNKKQIQYPKNEYSIKNFLLELFLLALAILIATIPYQASVDISHELFKILKDPVSAKTEDSFIHSIFTFAILYAIGSIISNIFIKKAINKNYMIPKEWNEISYKDIKQVIFRYSLFITILSAFSFSSSFFLLFLQQKFSLILPMPEITYVIAAIFTLKYCVLTPLFYKKLSIS